MNHLDKLSAMIAAGLEKVRAARAAASTLSPALSKSIPTAFLLNAVTLLTLLPDRNGIFVVSQLLHQYGQDLWAACAVPCAACDAVRSAGAGWQWRAAVISWCYGIVHATTAPNARVPINVPAVIIAGPGLEPAIKGVLANLSDADFERALHPDTPLVLKIKKDRGDIRATLVTDHRDFGERRLPDRFPQLHQYQGVHEPPTAEMMARFRAKLAEEMGTKGTDAEVPDPIAPPPSSPLVIDVAGESPTVADAAYGNGQFEDSLPATCTLVREPAEEPLPSPAPTCMLADEGAEIDMAGVSEVDLDAAIPPPENCQGWGKYGHNSQCDECEWSIECERMTGHVSTFRASTQSMATEEADSRVQVSVSSCQFAFGHPRSVPQCMTCARGDECWAEASSK
jgi:hypothetical protein